MHRLNIVAEKAINEQGEGTPLLHRRSGFGLLNYFFQSSIAFTSDINNETKNVSTFVLRDSVPEETVKLIPEETVEAILEKFPVSR